METDKDMDSMYTDELKKKVSHVFQQGLIKLGKMKLWKEGAYKKRDNEINKLYDTMETTYQQLHAFTTMYPGIIIQSDNKEEVYESISAALSDIQGPSGRGFVDGTEGMSQGSSLSGAATTVHLQRLYDALYQLRHPDAPVPHDENYPGRNNAPLVYLAYVLLHGTDQDVCSNALITRLGETITKQEVIREMETGSCTTPPAGPPPPFPPAPPARDFPPLEAVSEAQLEEIMRSRGYTREDPSDFAPEPQDPAPRTKTRSRGGGKKPPKKGKVTKGKCKYSYKCNPHKKKQLCTYIYKCPSKKSKSGSKHGKCKYTYKCKGQKKKMLCKYTYKCSK